MNWNIKILFEIVRTLQNYNCNSTQDHLTICGFFETEDEYWTHIDSLVKDTEVDTLKLYNFKVI